MVICGKDIKVQGRVLRMARLEADKYEFIDDPQAMLDSLRKHERRIDLFTFIQRIPETEPKYSYPMEWDNLAVLPVSSFDHWWKEQIGFKARNKAKQAEKKGIVVREIAFDESLVRGIWKIYNESPVRQGKRFPHYGMSLDRVREYAGTFPASSLFIGAFLDESLIGFVKLTWHETRTQANLMHIVSMIQHRDKAPTNALIAQAVRSCAERNIPYLVYSNFSYGKKHRDSLSDFKERNGFQRMDLPRYYVPLTAIGWAGFRLGLHRRAVDLIPDSVGAKLRALRKAFYSRKDQFVTEA